MAKVHRIHSLPDDSPWDGGLPPEGSAEHPRTIRALDRVLLWNHYYIPQWHSADEWIAWWDKFGFVDSQPAYAGIDFQSWWVRPEAMQ